jgi:RNA polymerase sigma-70 factor (ECF subfamily)
VEINKSLIKKNIALAKAGKQSAYNFLLDTYWNEVYGFQLKRVHKDVEAEDITIETFSKAFDKIATFNEDYVFSTWLIAISKNIHIDKIRKKNAGLYANISDTSEEKIKNVADPSPTPEDILIKEQNLAELLRYIKQLKPAYQEVINLRYFQEMSYKEISDRIEIPLSNIKVRLLRAKKLLAEIIQAKRNN